MDIDKVYSSFHRVAPQLRTVGEIRENVDKITEALSKSGDVTSLGFDPDKPLVDQVEAALCASDAEARLQACINATQNREGVNPTSATTSRDEADSPNPKAPPNTEGTGEQGGGWSWGSIGRWTIFGVSLYQLLGIFRSEKNWFKVILGAIGAAVTAFWGKIRGTFGGNSGSQVEAPATK